MNRIVAWGLGTLFGLVLILVLAFSLSGTVDQTQRGLYLRNGAVTGTVEPGRYFKLPIIDDVWRVYVGTRNDTWEQPQEAYSYDQQPGHFRLSVTWAIPGDAETVTQVYERYGADGGRAIWSRRLGPVALQQLKIVTGRFTALRAVQERGALNTQVAEAIATAVKGEPFHIIGVQIEDVQFSDGYMASIEARMKAEVEVQTQAQNVRKEEQLAAIQVTKAKGWAESKLAEARATAEATKLQGEAEAAAIRARSEALAQSSNVIGLTLAEKWDGKLPTTMPPGSTVPFLSLPGAPK